MKHLNGNSKIVNALQVLRQEWQEAADGQPLAEVHGSVGLLLADLAGAAGLTHEEIFEALGSQLAELVN